MFSTKLTAVLALFAAAAATVNADVLRPRITEPTTGQVWKGDSSQTISWDPPALPVGALEPVGSIFLGYFDPQSPGEHLNIDSPLASNVSMFAGSVRVHVPKVKPRTSYIIALFDSGNVSPQFEITD
ncbi:hypothetical protein C8Q77DRAFT_1076406 [Trametes polyzona]|nr:hypothetical protein C8Q77DRAFT_1076406 [Trametes polyzona]